MRLTPITFTTVALLIVIGIGSTAAQEGAQANREKLMNPGKLTETAPDKFRAKFDTSKGEFIIEVTRSWAPNGADRFYNLVKNGYYNDCRFFRVIEDFMAQFGISGDPKLNAVWSSANIKDDPVKQHNLRTFVTFAKSSQPNSRTTQVFINYKDNSDLDESGFSPFGRVIKGIAVADALFPRYGGEGPPKGTGPDQGRIQSEGNAYLEKSFPKLDYIKSATIVDAGK
jgi:peptidyl-prolyl cis-trans isomerase A (cyclophilin A)